MSKKQETQVFNCEKCKNEFPGIMNLKKHLKKTMKQETQVFNCRKCKNKFPGVRNKKNHLKSP